jgi:hypothetical protein
MATTSEKRHWLGLNLSIDLGQGDKRQATASGTFQKMHDSKVSNTWRRRVAAAVWHGHG